MAEQTTTQTSTGSLRERSSRASGRKRKKRRNQIPLGILLFVIIVGVGIWLTLSNPAGNTALFWIIGIAFGFILQRSRFCFTASMRDPALTGSTSVTKAVLIAFAITSIAFTAIKFGAYSNGLAIPGQSYVAPVSVATGVGAFMFGIGMVIAGGCASGTLMRVGEGFWMQLISLFFFVVGSLLGAASFGWWERTFIVGAPRIFLPELFGGTDGVGNDGLAWIGGLVANLLIIAIIYVIAHKWGNRKSKNELEH